ncbi:MAG: hypothetical protein ABI847_00100 [Anaerolineales bacterium]
MTNNTWNWAQLADDQLQRLKHAEQTLGADILLAFQGAGEVSDAKRSVPDLQAAELSESQVECLRGTEAQLNVVVVAYKQME